MAGSFAYDIDFPLIGNHGGPDTPSSPPSSPPRPAYTSGSSLSASPTLPSTGAYGIQLPPHPETPREWIWRCHLCKARYNLATTRRCLTDGHYYCYGKGAGKNIKPKLRGKPCPSVFDYSGWEDWNDWRKRVQQIRFLWDEDEGPPAPPTERNCVENCYFPSACRYLETVQDMYMFDPSHMDVSAKHSSLFQTLYQLSLSLLTNCRQATSAPNSQRMLDVRGSSTTPRGCHIPSLQRCPSSSMGQNPSMGQKSGPSPSPSPNQGGKGGTMENLNKRFFLLKILRPPNQPSRGCLWQLPRGCYS